MAVFGGSPDCDGPGSVPPTEYHIYILSFPVSVDLAERRRLKKVFGFN